MEFTIVDARRLISGLGVPPVGNPNAMRAYADRLSQMADGMAASTLLFDKSAPVPNVSGPAADRWVGRAKESVGKSQQVAHEIQAVAAAVRAAASRLEQDQHLWRSRFNGLGVPGALAGQVLRQFGWRIP